MIAARDIQAKRFGRDAQEEEPREKISSYTRSSRTYHYNAQMSSRKIRQHCQLDQIGLRLLRDAMNDFGLSARAHDKVLRIARTIADLDASPRIEVQHITEAINYRILDRTMWV